MENITFNETIQIAMNIIIKIYMKAKKNTLQRKRRRNVFEKLYDNTQTQKTMAFEGKNKHYRLKNYTIKTQN